MHDLMIALAATHLTFIFCYYDHAGRICHIDRHMRFSANGVETA